MGVLWTVSMVCRAIVRKCSEDRVVRTFFGFFGGFVVGGASSSGTVHFLPFVRVVAAVVDRVAREVAGFGGGWLGGGRLADRVTAALPPRPLPQPVIFQE